MLKSGKYNSPQRVEFAITVRVNYRNSKSRSGKMSLDLSLKNPEINFKAGVNGRITVYAFADFKLHTESKLLFKDGKELHLTPKAVETLLVLVQRNGQVVGKDELMRKVWPDTIVEESNLA